MAGSRGRASGEVPAGVVVVAALAGVVTLGALWLASREGGRKADRPAPVATNAITLPDGEVLDAIDAQSRCESMIRRQLPDPGSANFANRFSSGWQDPVRQGNSWRFVATVAYRSGSGTPARARFVCVLDGNANTITVTPLP